MIQIVFLFIKTYTCDVRFLYIFFPTVFKYDKQQSTVSYDGVGQSFFIYKNTKKKFTK